MTCFQQTFMKEIYRFKIEDRKKIRGWENIGNHLVVQMLQVTSLDIFDVHRVCHVPPVEPT